MRRALSKVLRGQGGLRRNPLTLCERYYRVNPQLQGKDRFRSPGPEPDLSVWPRTFKNQKISQIRKIRRSDLTGPTVPRQTSNQMERPGWQSTCGPPCPHPHCSLRTPNTAGPFHCLPGPLNKGTGGHVSAVIAETVGFLRMYGCLPSTSQGSWSGLAH